MSNTILVTGGTGTIGGAVVRKLVCEPGQVVRVFSRDEYKQWQMQQGPIWGAMGSQLRFLLGDVRDLNRLRMAMRGVDTVYHCAALKQVPACEYNPFEAVQTNVVGTQNVLTAAVEAGSVKKLLFVSTDKAVEPASVMGASKMLAERIVLAANAWTSPKERTFESGGYSTKLETGGVRCCAVRLGNVIGSRGSFHELASKAVAEGKPIEVTDPAMTRFWISAGTVADWLLWFAGAMTGGEIFAPVMPARKLEDVMEQEFPGVGTRAIGVRTGEKMHELLFDESEVENVVVKECAHGAYLVWRKGAKTDQLPGRSLYDSSVL